MGVINYQLVKELVNELCMCSQFREQNGQVNFNGNGRSSLRRGAGVGF